MSRCALKIDLMKAYDTVRLDFMLEVLRIIRFPERMVGWIGECMTSTMFSISINCISTRKRIISLVPIIRLSWVKRREMTLCYCFKYV